MEKTEKKKNIVTVGIFAVFFCGFFGWCLLKPMDAVSDSERRPLAKRPSFSMEALTSGDFMKDFENYAMDQFPMRERFRRLKAVSSFYLFRQKDVGGIYLTDGYASKLEYPMNTDSLDHAAERFRYLYEKYLKGRSAGIYFSVIPDKNCFMAETNGYPAIDYEEFTSYLREKADYMKYIDIFGCLELSDYYKTDTHWRQEKITDVATRLAEGMGNDLFSQYKYETVELENPFYGVYYGQSALPLPAERICYLENEVLRSCVVYDYETNTEIPVYDMEKAEGKDPYELFLGGSKSLLKINNPKAKTDKKLIIFRDSFGSSIAPLLFEGYAEITLIDIRYLSGELLGNFVDFENCDVLFLCSTLVLNNSVTLK